MEKMFEIYLKGYFAYGVKHTVIARFEIQSLKKE